MIRPSFGLKSVRCSLVPVKSSRNCILLMIFHFHEPVVRLAKGKIASISKSSNDIVRLNSLNHLIFKFCDKRSKRNIESYYCKSLENAVRVLSVEQTFTIILIKRLYHSVIDHRVALSASTLQKSSMKIEFSESSITCYFLVFIHIANCSKAG